MVAGSVCVGFMPGRALAPRHKDAANAGVGLAMEQNWSVSGRDQMCGAVQAFVRACGRRLKADTLGNWRGMAHCTRWSTMPESGRCCLPSCKYISWQNHTPHTGHRKAAVAWLCAAAFWSFEGCAVCNVNLTARMSRVQITVAQYHVGAANSRACGLRLNLQR